VVVELVRVKRVVACLPMQDVMRLSGWMPSRRVVLHRVLLEAVAKESSLLDHAATELLRIVQGLPSLKELVKTELREESLDQWGSRGWQTYRTRSPQPRPACLYRRPWTWPLTQTAVHHGNQRLANGAITGQMRSTVMSRVVWR
jgi:hypothetical protein